MEGRVTAEVSQGRVRAGQDQAPYDRRLMRKHRQVQGRLAVVVQDVQQAGVRRHLDQTERGLHEALHDRDVQLPAK